MRITNRSILLAFRTALSRHGILQDGRQSDLSINLLHALKVGTRCALGTKYGVHLLERQPLRLGHDEPDKGSAQHRQAPEEDVRPVGDLLQHVGRHLPDDEVVHPVRRRAQGDSIGPRAEGPDLRHEDPGAGAPGVAEMDDEEPDHADGGPARCGLIFPIICIPCEDDGDNKVAGTVIQRK